jgi:hypothetical protein
VFCKTRNPEFLRDKEDYLDMVGNFGRNREFAGCTDYGKINSRELTRWQRNLPDVLERSF